MNKIIEILFKAADDHGEDTGELDHSIGDLQDLLREVWSILDADQMTQFLSSGSVENLLSLREEYSPEDLVDMIEEERMPKVRTPR